MCLNPVLLPNGREVACRKCWQCIRRKIDDWCGRCIAESRTAAATHLVTLTYGRDRHIDAVDHLQAAVLTYSDVQKFLRSYRDAGFPVRYFVVGEYGSMKGRAHWHALLFWPEKVPEKQLGVRQDDEHWPHGHTFWQRSSPETVRYVCKYIAKEAETEERQYQMGLSRMPPLGDDYFRDLARRHVEAGLAPQDFVYEFADVCDRHGKVIKYTMRGKTRENFLRYFVHGWWERYGDHPPESEIVSSFIDDPSRSESRAELQKQAQRVLDQERAGVRRLGDVTGARPFTGMVRKPNPSDLRRWMDPQRLRFSETLNVWLYTFEGGQGPWYWAKSADGVYGWRARIGADFRPGGIAYEAARNRL